MNITRVDRAILKPLMMRLIWRMSSISSSVIILAIKLLIPCGVMRSIRDDSTDPETKERLIEDLKAGLGAEGRDAYEDRLDTRLYMQLSLHADELMTMTDEQRKEKIKEIRYRVYANEGFH